MTDSTPSVQVHVNNVVQHKSGNKRKRPAPIRVQSFDYAFNDLMAFKAKYGHCDASQTGENASLGRWCSALRFLYKEIQNSQMPTRMKQLKHDESLTARVERCSHVPECG
jgi:hypothetical protein